MLMIISYDVSDDKKRAKLAKYLAQFGSRIQYSVFKIEQAQRFLTTLIAELQEKIIVTLDPSDSVYVFRPCSSCQIELLTGGEIEEETFMIIQ